MNEWVWSIGEIKWTGEIHSSRCETCSSATLSTTNFRWTGLELNLSPHTEKLAITHSRYSVILIVDTWLSRAGWWILVTCALGSGRVSYKEMSIFLEVIVSVILSKKVYMYMCYSERFLRWSYFTEQFRFGTQNCPSLPPYCASLDFCLRGWMKRKVYRTKVDTRDELLDLVMDVIASIKEHQDALRQATRHDLTSCKLHWCWRWNFRKCIVVGKLYQLCQSNNKYQY